MKRKIAEILIMMFFLVFILSACAIDNENHVPLVICLVALFGIGLCNKISKEESDD